MSSFLSARFLIFCLSDIFCYLSNDQSGKLFSISALYRFVELKATTTTAAEVGGDDVSAFGDSWIDDLLEELPGESDSVLELRLLPPEACWLSVSLTGSPIRAGPLAAAEELVASVTEPVDEELVASVTELSQSVEGP